MRGRFEAILVRGLLAIVLAGAAMPLAGCWDIRYLDKLGVALAIGVDDDPEGKMRYQVTVQIVLPQNASTNEGGGDGSPIMTITETGDTLFEAIRKMSTKTSRRLFFSHTQLLVISEETARKGIFPLMDLIERNADIRSDISVVIARGMKAEQLLQIRTQMESIPAYQMKEIIDVNERAQGQTYSVLVRDIARIADSEGMEVVVPAMGAQGNAALGNTTDNTDRINPEVLPELTTMGIFRKGKLIGFLTPRQSRGLTWLENKLTSTVVKFSCPESSGHYIAEVSSANTKMRAMRHSPGSELPVISIEVRFEANIHEVTCPNFMITDENTLRQAEQVLNKAVEEEMKSTINVLQKKMKVDALGWGQAVYRDHPALWKSISGDWTEIYPHTEYRIHCFSRIESMGTRTNSIVK